MPSGGSARGPDAINPAALSKPVGYSHGMKATGTVVAIAGQVAWDRDEKIVSDDFAAQFAKALENVVEVARAAGGSARHIASLTIFVTSKEEYLASRKRLGGEYRRIMGSHYPAMTLVEIKGLIETGAKVEIQGLAVL